MGFKKKYLVKTASVMDIMAESDKDKRIEMMCNMCDKDHIEIKKDRAKSEQAKKEGKPYTRKQFTTYYAHLNLSSDDSYKEQNVKLLCMLACGRPKLIINLENLNKYFGVNYKSLAEAKSNLLKSGFKDLGFLVSPVRYGKSILKYEVKIDSAKVEELIIALENSSLMQGCDLE